MVEWSSGMSKIIKVAADADLLNLLAQRQESFQREHCVQLNVIGIFKKDLANENELKNALEDIEVSILSPDQFPAVVKCMPSSMKWAHSTFAGVEFVQSLDKSSQAKLKKCIITRNSGVFSGRMAEYVITAVISMERNFKIIYEKQMKRDWQECDYVRNYRSLPSLSIGILGLGVIGKEVAKVCRSLGMTVYGLKRTPAPCEFVKRVFAMDELPEFLQASDYVCNLLPSTPETKGLLSGNILENCAQRKAAFINIGRGDVIDENSIIAALNNGWISKAFLDVFEEEPLPKSSKLWLMDNVTVTPHVSGLCHNEHIVKLFYNNLAKYLKGEKLEYVYSWEKGY